MNTPIDNPSKDIIQAADKARRFLNQYETRWFNDLVPLQIYIPDTPEFKPDETFITDILIETALAYDPTCIYYTYALDIKYVH